MPTERWACAPGFSPASRRRGFLGGLPPAFRLGAGLPWVPTLKAKADGASSDEGAGNQFLLAAFLEGFISAGSARLAV